MGKYVLSECHQTHIIQNSSVVVQSGEMNKYMCLFFTSHFVQPERNLPELSRICRWRDVDDDEILKGTKAFFVLVKFGLSGSFFCVFLTGRFR